MRSVLGFADLVLNPLFVQCQFMQQLFHYINDVIVKRDILN